MTRSDLGTRAAPGRATRPPRGEGGRGGGEHQGARRRGGARLARARATTQLLLAC